MMEVIDNMPNNQQGQQPFYTGNGQVGMSQYQPQQQAPQYQQQPYQGQYQQPQYPQPQQQYQPIQQGNQYQQQTQPFDQQQSINTISHRLYLLLTGGIVAASFGVIAWMYQYFTQSNALETMGFGTILAMFIVPFVAIFAMGFAKSKENLPVMVISYLAFVATFGGTTAIALTYYELPTITAAFGITLFLSLVFAFLGFVMPQVFQRAMPIAMVGLLVVIVAEVIMMLMGVQQTLTDYIVIGIFCIITGYDYYRAANDTPTVTNAIWHACDVFLDAVNILLRVLSIMGGSRSRD